MTDKIYLYIHFCFKYLFKFDLKIKNISLYNCGNVHFHCIENSRLDNQLKDSHTGFERYWSSKILNSWVNCPFKLTGLDIHVVWITHPSQH